jgi:nucleotide-binding universal stress UspA family protein
MGASTWESLLELAEAEDADAIVVGTRGRTGVGSLIGSVSDGLVHHSDRPVVVVPPPDVAKTRAERLHHHRSAI